MKKILSIIGFTFILCSCATNNYVSDANNITEVQNKIVTIKSEFGEDFIVAPLIKFDYSGLLYIDTLSVQLAYDKVNSRYFLYFYNMYPSDWKFVKSITTLDHQTYEFKNVDRKVSKILSCQPSCYLEESGFIEIEKEYLDGTKDFKFRLNSNKGGMVGTFPKNYIKALNSKLN